MKKILEVGKIFKARCPKCNCLFQYEKEDIQVEKKELDNAADMRMPIKNTIDIAIKKVTE